MGPLEREQPRGARVDELTRTLRRLVGTRVQLEVEEQGLPAYIGGALVEIVLYSVYCARPSGPNSRPMPLAL